MSLLRDRRFALLVVGQAVNGIGSWCALIALWGYAAYKYDAGPAQIALLSASWAVAAAILGPLGGVPVDRFGPRRTLIIADAGAALVSIAMAFSTAYWQLVALGVLIGLVRTVSEPAITALAPRLVDDDQLVQANAILGGALMSSIAFGPLLAAGAIALWGPRGAFLIDACTYAIGIAVVIPLRLRAIERTEVHEHPSAVRELRAGFAAIRDRADVRRVLGLSASVYLVWGAYIVIEPIYVRDVLHRPASTFALLQSTFGIVLLFGSYLIARVGEPAAKMKTLRIAALVCAASAPVYVGTKLVVAAFIGIAMWGMATAWFVAPRNTLLQRAMPPEMHGRVFAADRTLCNWAQLISMPTAAILIGAFGVRAAAFTFACMPIIGVLATRHVAVSTITATPAPEPA